MITNEMWVFSMATLALTIIGGGIIFIHGNQIVRGLSRFYSRYNRHILFYMAVLMAGVFIGLLITNAWEYLAGIGILTMLFKK